MPNFPSELITCPMCGSPSPFKGVTSVTYGGDESYKVARYICEGLISHTTWTTYGPVRDLGYGDASTDAGPGPGAGDTMKVQGGA